MPERRLELIELPGVGWQLKWDNEVSPLATSTEKWVLQAALDAHTALQKRARGECITDEKAMYCMTHQKPMIICGMDRESGKDRAN